MKQRRWRVRSVRRQRRFCQLSTEGTHRRQPVDVFASSHGHEKDQPNNTRDTTPGVDWISVNQL